MPAPELIVRFLWKIARTTFPVPFHKHPPAWPSRVLPHLLGMVSFSLSAILISGVCSFDIPGMLTWWATAMNDMLIAAVTIIASLRHSQRDQMRRSTQTPLVLCSFQQWTTALSMIIKVVSAIIFQNTTVIFFKDNITFVSMFCPWYIHDSKLSLQERMTQ